MIKEFDMNCLHIHENAIFYEYDGKKEIIDIKKSAELWRNKHHKSTIIDVLLKKCPRNKYAGDKKFDFTEAYIRFYVGMDEIVFRNKFTDEPDTSDACEFRMWWDDINIKLNQQGYWLFDEG